MEHARQIPAHLHSIELSLKDLDEARAKIDTNMSTLRPMEVSDAIEAIDETLRTILSTLKLLVPA